MSIKRLKKEEYKKLHDSDNESGINQNHVILKFINFDFNPDETGVARANNCVHCLYRYGGRSIACSELDSDIVNCIGYQCFPNF